jgi:hypothetical protein
MSSSGDAVHIVWIYNVDGQPDMFLRASGNEESSFGSIKNLSNSNGGSFGSQIEVSDSNVYAVWITGTKDIQTAPTKPVDFSLKNINLHFFGILYSIFQHNPYMI